MKIIYIAGPYTADTEARRAANVLAAQNAALPIVGRAFPVVPHSISIGLDTAGTPEFWYEATLALMHRCDAVFALPTWEASKGATASIRAADRAGLPVFYSHDELFLWIDGKATGTFHGQRGTLAELLGGLPQTLVLRCAGRAQEVRAWRKEADDGLIYGASTIGRIQLFSRGELVFEQVDEAAPVTEMDEAETVPRVVVYSAPPPPDFDLSRLPTKPPSYLVKTPTEAEDEADLKDRIAQGKGLPRPSSH